MNRKARVLIVKVRQQRAKLLAVEQLAAVAGLRGDEGARRLLRGGLMIECGRLCPGIDVDTPEQLETARELFSRRT